jgi:hypothetical protein
MKKESRYAMIALVAFCIIFLLGLVFIFKAPAIGQSKGYKILQQSGGVYVGDLDRERDRETETYRIAGTALTIVGGIGSTLFLYAVINKEENSMQGGPTY